MEHELRLTIIIGSNIIIKVSVLFESEDPRFKFEKNGLLKMMYEYV